MADPTPLRLPEDLERLVDRALIRRPDDLTVACYAGHTPGLRHGPRIETELCGRQWTMGVAALLSALTGRPFFLAKSGTQGGRDISSRYPYANIIAVECKRYKSNTELNERELLGEIAQAVADISDLDLWALVASREVPSQLRAALQKATTDQGIELLVISDNDGAPSSLEALCACAPAIVERYFPEDVPLVQQLLSEIANASEYGYQLTHLRKVLATPLIGYDNWRARQSRWLRDAFESESESRPASLADCL